MATVLHCTDLDAMVRFLHDEVGLRIDVVSPADDPAEFAMSGKGASVIVRRGDADVVGHVVLRTEHLAAGAAAELLIAPNGSVIESVPASLDVVVPANVPTFSVVRGAGGFGAGRAGMEYRDLLPDRWGGRFIASHIRISEGGDVDDYVHFHRIRFQMIFVAAGWVEVVYEDQGEPFRMNAGDCVLQPPEIRHRVLRSSPGLEVIEVGCPAMHDTVAEHRVTLPTSTVRRDRRFGGQRFVRHVAADAVTVASVHPRFTERDTGIELATDGLVGARVLAASAGQPAATDPMASTGPARSTIAVTHHGEFALVVGLAGRADLSVDVDSTSHRIELGPRDAVALPAGASWAWSDWSDDFEILDVTVPARTVTAV